MEATTRGDASAAVSTGVVGHSAFQRALLATDPRGVIVFTANIDDILGFVTATAGALKRPVKVYPTSYRSPGNNNNRGPAGSEAAGKPPLASGYQSDVVDIAFMNALAGYIDGGVWVILPDLTQLSAPTWRQIGKVLFSLAPDDTFRGRAAFRLMVFVPDTTMDPATVLPPMIMQNAFRIDGRANVQCRSTLVPLFDGTTSMPRLAQLKTAYTVEAEQPLSDNSHHRSADYLKLLAVSTAVNMEVYGGAKQPATSPQYITEILVAVRDVLAQEQAALIDEAKQQDQQDQMDRRALKKSRRQVAAGGAAGGALDSYDDFDDASSFSSTNCSDSFHSSDPSGSTAAAALLQAGSHVAALEEQYDWIYQKLLAWVVDQCPDVDISAISSIDPDELSVDAVVRIAGVEHLHCGLWNGCKVLIKSIDATLASSSLVSQAKKALMQEAARHFPLRHPQILSLYGIEKKESKVICEGIVGTLEQMLIQARFDNQRWTVRHFFGLAIQILQGMVFLSTASLVHRDISCRSIVLSSESGTFKISQFGLALPLRHPATDAMRGVIPVRWTAPEGFAAIFTPRSDMWSFGVLMWMAVQYCTQQPYANMKRVDPQTGAPLAEELHAPDAIKSGIPLVMPRECPPELWQYVIVPCLQFDATLRPTALQHLSNLQSVMRALPKPIWGKLVPFPLDGCAFQEYNEQLPQVASTDPVAMAAAAAAAMDVKPPMPSWGLM